MSTNDISAKRIPSQAITLEEYLAGGGVPLVSNKPPDTPESPAATSQSSTEVDDEAGEPS